MFLLNWYRVAGLLCLALVVLLHQSTQMLLGEVSINSIHQDRSELALVSFRQRLLKQNSIIARKVRQLLKKNTKDQETKADEDENNVVIDNRQEVMEMNDLLPLKVEELCPKPTRTRRRIKPENDKNKTLVRRGSVPAHADDFINKTSSPVVIFYFPKGDFGLLCNVLHQVSNGLDVAMTFPDLTRQVIFALEFNQSIQIQAAFDMEMLIKGLRQVSKLDLNYLGIKERLRDIEMILDWKAEKHHELARNKGHLIIEFSIPRLMRMRRNENSIALTYFLRPHVEHRQKAEQVVREFRDKHPDQYLLSVHRRVFTWCTKAFKLHSPFCSKQPDYVFFKYFDDTCNVTMTPKLIQLAAQEFLGKDDFPRPFSVFLASDLHDLAGDATFYDWANKNGREVVNIPHPENPEHVVSIVWATKLLENDEKKKSEWTNRLNLTMDELNQHKSRYQHIKDFIRSRFDGFNMNWDMSMLTDMHAQTLSDYAIGQPFSSCDRILALWRSVWGKAAFSAYLESNNEWDVDVFKQHLIRWERRLGQVSKFHQMYPKSCYEPFDHPKPGEYELVTVMNKWWKEYEEYWLNETSEFTVPSFNGSFSGIQKILPPYELI